MILDPIYQIPVLGPIMFFIVQAAGYLDNAVNLNPLWGAGLLAFFTGLAGYLILKSLLKRPTHKIGEVLFTLLVIFILFMVCIGQIGTVFTAAPFVSPGKPPNFPTAPYTPSVGTPVSGGKHNG